MDLLALASMKNAAKCDTWCELQNRDSSNLWTHLAPSGIPLGIPVWVSDSFDFFFFLLFSFFFIPKEKKREKKGCCRWTLAFVSFFFSLEKNKATESCGLKEMFFWFALRDFLWVLLATEEEEKVLRPRKKQARRERQQRSFFLFFFLLAFFSFFLFLLLSSFFCLAQRKHTKRGDNKAGEKARNKERRKSRVPCQWKQNVCSAFLFLNGARCLDLFLFFFSSCKMNLFDLKSGKSTRWT